MITLKRKLFAVGILLLCISGCVSLNEVATFATASTKSLQSISIPYGSYEFCRDSGYIYKNNIGELKDVLCDCHADSLRDTVILHEAAILSSYYDALSKLAGNGKSFDVSALGKSIKKGTYGHITVSDGEATTFGNVTLVIQNLVNAGYKSEKVQQIVKANDTSVQKAIHFLSLQIDNLEGFVAVMKSKYQTNYTVLIHNAEGSATKYPLVGIYLQKSQELERALQNYEAVKKSLAKILEGDQLIVTHINDLDDAGFKTNILKIAGNIIYLNSKNNN